MGFAKVVIMFLMVAMFAVMLIGAAAVAFKDKPLDQYYENESNTVTGTAELGEVAFSVSGNLMIPILAVAGILVLFAGFMILSRRR